MEVLRIFITPEFYLAAIRLTTPILLAAMGGLLAERAGILNLALEGMLLMGAFFSYVVRGISKTPCWACSQALREACCLPRC